MGVTGDVQGDSNLIVNGVDVNMRIYMYIYLYFYAFYYIHNSCTLAFLAAVEGHFCQQPLRQVLSSCSVRPKKDRTAVPGGSVFFCLAHSSASTSRSEKFKIEKFFKAV